jgi:hypothetical protein
VYTLGEGVFGALKFISLHGGGDSAPWEATRNTPSSTGLRGCHACNSASPGHHAVVHAGTCEHRREEWEDESEQGNLSSDLSCPPCVTLDKLLNISGPQSLGVELVHTQGWPCS